METKTANDIHEAVAAVYGMVAKTKGRTSCCTVELETPQDYSPEELASVPPGAYLGQGSGNPVRHAALQPGEVVVDLGSGAGMDSFLAANRVGPSGRVHGFDLTPEMLERARGNAARYPNVSFEHAQIERLPFPDASADAAISNCVINLAPDKRVVYDEIYRVLRPGGRISVADIVLRGAPDQVSAVRENPDLASWCGCILGALEENEYLGIIRAAGFGDVKIVSERAAMSQPGHAVKAVAITVTARKLQ